MIELIVLGGILWWFGKKGKEALEERRISDTDFRLAQLAEKHRIPYEASDGTRITWDQHPQERAPDTIHGPQESRIELHDHRSIHQHRHLHFHVKRDDEA